MLCLDTKAPRLKPEKNNAYTKQFVFTSINTHTNIHTHTYTQREDLFIAISEKDLATTRSHSNDNNNTRVSFVAAAAAGKKKKKAFENLNSRMSEKTQKNLLLYTIFNRNTRYSARRGQWDDVEINSRERIMHQFTMGEITKHMSLEHT